MYKLDSHQLLDECCNGSIRVSQNSVCLHQSVHTEFYLYEYEDLYLYLFIVLLYIVIRDLTLLLLCSALHSSAVTRTIHFSLHQLQFHTHSPSFFLFLFPFLLQRAILSNAAPSNKSVIPPIKTALSYSALFLFYFTDCVFVSIMSYPFMTFY